MSEVVERKIDRSSLAGGIVLIVIGLIFLAATFGFAEFGDVIRRFWPFVIVLIGIPKLFSRETVWSGLWMISLGLWLYVSHFRLFGLSYATSWPLLLIVIGAGMTLRSIFDRGTRFPRREP